MNYNLKIQGTVGKKILVIGCVHGDELIGQKVINHLRQLKISGGTLTTVIAHTKAIKAKKRFIDQDLNRSFPGKAKGNHEEQLALSLLPLIKKADIVLDIHSTTTDTTSAIILTKVNPSIRKLLITFNPKRVVLMEKKVAKTALTGYCKAGISFEYGKDKSETAFQETLTDILKILAAHRLVKESKTRKMQRNKKENQQRSQGATKWEAWEPAFSRNAKKNVRYEYGQEKPAMERWYHSRCKADKIFNKISKMAF